MTIQSPKFAHVEKTMAESHSVSQVVTAGQLHCELVVEDLLVSPSHGDTEQEMEKESQE